MFGLDSMRKFMRNARGLAKTGRTALRANLLTPPERLDPRALVTIALSGGVGVRNVHALHAAMDPERVAFIDCHRRCTYRAANTEIEAVAATLRDRWGVSPRAPVALCMENRIEYAILWFALFRLGVPCVHLSRSSTTREVLDLVARSRARVVVGSAQTRAVLEDAFAGVAQTEFIDVDTDYRTLCRPGSRVVSGVAGTSDNIVYTSGTTGQPKGAVRNFAAFGPRTLIDVLERLPMRRGDTHLVVAPLYHSAGQVFTLLGAALGNTVVLEPEFDAVRTLQRMHDQGVDTVFMVPTMLQRILALPGSVFSSYPVTPRAIVCGAAPFHHPLRCAAIERFGAGSIFDFYGATELGWVTFVDGAEMRAKPGSLGPAIPGQEIAIFDDDGRRLPPGAIGRIFTRSAQRMDGYLAELGASARPKPIEWMSVDDLGYLDADGSLFLTGRARDMVISGGVNIYPVEIEQVLCAHPSLDDVAVVGIRDQRWGECLVACCTGEAVEDASLIAWAKERLAPQKVPRRWIWLDTLPRNPTGKVRKVELVRRLEALEAGA